MRSHSHAHTHAYAPCATHYRGRCQDAGSKPVRSAQDNYAANLKWNDPPADMFTHTPVSKRRVDTGAMPAAASPQAIHSPFPVPHAQPGPPQQQAPHQQPHAHQQQHPMHMQQPQQQASPQPPRAAPPQPQPKAPIPEHVKPILDTLDLVLKAAAENAKGASILVLCVCV